MSSSERRRPLKTAAGTSQVLRLPSGTRVSSALAMSAPTVTSKDVFQPDVRNTINQTRTVLSLVLSSNCSNVGFIGLGIIFFLSPRDTYLTL